MHITCHTHIYVCRVWNFFCVLWFYLNLLNYPYKHDEINFFYRCNLNNQTNTTLLVHDMLFEEK